MSTIPSFRYVHIENTNHCHSSCYFCPREKLTRRKGFMSVERFQFTVSRLAQDLAGFAGHVHLHGYGEPLLDRHLAEKVRIARQTWPDAYLFIVSTAAVPVTGDHFAALAASGLNEIRISAYAFESDSYRRIYGRDSVATLQHNLAALAPLVQTMVPKFRVSVKLPPRQMYEEVGLAWDEAQVAADAARLQASGFTAGVMDELFNFGDGRTFKTAERQQVCSIVDGFRRDQLFLDWQLNVVPCCYDYNTAVVFGNLASESLMEIFAGNAYREFIAAHQAGLRANYPLCANCDRA